MTGVADLIYIIHGSNAHTWWRRLANGGYPWWRRWSLFSCAVRRAFQAECEVREFRWSGINTHQGRINAGLDLARTIEREGAGRRVHLIGHSHGGNVALAAVNQLPAHRIESLIALANPNMALSEGGAQPATWLYWGNAPQLVRRIWNLYSSEDFVQTKLARWFHGLTPEQRKQLSVKPNYEGSIENGEVRWTRRISAHRSMHSEAMGSVVGALLRGSSFEDAMKNAGLSEMEGNQVRDRGGWPGSHRVFETIQGNADPSPFVFGETTKGVGVLFIHGFTASPAEMRPMAQAVVQATEWRCVGLLLPGHGTHLKDMRQTSGKDWTEAVERAYEELSRKCDRVFVVGLSLGASLACSLARRRSGDPKLRGLILLAPAFGVTLQKALGIHLGRFVRSHRNKGSRASDYFLDHHLYSYLKIPLGLAAELTQLGRDAVQSMSSLRNLPVIMFVGDRESTVSMDKVLSVARDNSWIRLVRLPRSRHILTVEPDREMMFEASIRFMEECLRK